MLPISILYPFIIFINQYYFTHFFKGFWGFGEQYVTERRASKKQLRIADLSCKLAEFKENPARKD